MKRFQFICVVILSWGITNYSLGQYQDFGFWTGAKVIKEVNKKASFFGEVQARLMQNATQWDNLFFQVGGAYAFAKWYELGVSYRYADFGEFDVNRFDIDNNFKYKVDKHRFGFRVKFQKSLINPQLSGNRFRLRFKYAYRVNKKFRPYIKAQYFYTNVYKFNNWNEHRYSLGALVRVAKKNFLDVFYQYSGQFNMANPGSFYVLGLKYKLVYKS